MTAQIMTQPRMNPAEYVRLVGTQLRRYWKQLFLPLAVLAVIGIFVRFDINITQSLPQHMFVTVKGFKGDLKHGDYVSYIWHGGGPFPKGMPMVKIIAGVPGDIVTMDEDGGFWINGGANSLKGNFRGKAKTHSKTGEPLERGLTGVIPEGRYFVHAPHPDSLDSRYALTGWISIQQIQGRTFPLF